MGRHRTSEPQPDWAFRFMALGYRFRDARRSRKDFLQEAGIRPGDTVLDFGCGAGSYAIPAGLMAGNSGRVYTLDIQPLALRMVTDRARKAHLNNLSTILSDCNTGLPDQSVDVALLYDIYHDLSDPTAVLSELQRVLKPGGILSSHDHHMEKPQLKQAMESGGLFRAIREGELTLTFAPQERKNETGN
jgi:ubiquinone/menaquinone biosynthesis C-methylase UbiE